MQRLYWLVVLVILVTGSAMSVIYVKHKSRLLFSELRTVQKAQDLAVIKWTQLQLQSSTLTTQANIETVARTKLGMIIPDQIQIVTLID